MKRVFALWLVLVPIVFTFGCVSGGGSSNGAIRLLNAVADAPRMNLLLNGQARVSNLDYGAGSAWAAEAAAQYSVRIDKVLVSGAAPAPPVYNQNVTLGVNDEVTLMVVGEAAAGTEEVLEIRGLTQGVSIGRTRLRFVHAGTGVPALDVYVIAPDALPTASTPLISGLSYKDASPQQEVTGGTARIVLTEVGNPTAVRFDSGSIVLATESSLLIAVLPNPGAVAGDRSLMLTMLSGIGSTMVPDQDARAEVRAVNAAPDNSYSLDVFVNATSVGGSTRQDCDPGTAEADTLLELCALPFEAITSYGAIAPGSYGIKVQKTADDAVAAQTISASFTGSLHLSLVLTGLTEGAATTTTQGLMILNTTRRIAGIAQLRIASASLAADAAVAGDPTTDRLEVFIAAPGTDLTGRTADFVNLRLGLDTGYLSFLPGSYELTLAKVDTAAASGTAPEVLFTHPLTLDTAGIYTLVITDSTGGVQPLQALSLDDPTP